MRGRGLSNTAIVHPWKKASSPGRIIAVTIYLTPFIYAAI